MDLLSLAGWKSTWSTSDLSKTIPVAPGFHHLDCQTWSSVRFQWQGPTALRGQIKQQLQSQNHQLTSPKYLQPKSLLSQGWTVWGLDNSWKCSLGDRRLSPARPCAWNSPRFFQPSFPLLFLPFPTLLPSTSLCTRVHSAKEARSPVVWVVTPTIAHWRNWASPTSFHPAVKKPSLKQSYKCLRSERVLRSRGSSRPCVERSSDHSWSSLLSFNIHGSGSAPHDQHPANSPLWFMGSVNPGKRQQ